MRKRSWARNAKTPTYRRVYARDRNRGRSHGVADKRAREACLPAKTLGQKVEEHLDAMGAALGMPVEMAGFTWAEMICPGAQKTARATSWAARGLMHMASSGGDYARHLAGRFRHLSDPTPDEYEKALRDTERGATARERLTSILADSRLMRSDAVRERAIRDLGELDSTGELERLREEEEREREPIRRRFGNLG